MKVKARGLTLIEVLFALSIVSIALLALSGTLTQVIRHTSRLEEKLYADWVLQNEFNQIALHLTRERLGVGQTPFERTMGTLTFRGNIQVKTTHQEGVYQLQGDVFHGRRKVLSGKRYVVNNGLE